VQLTVNQLVVGSIPASGASIGGLVIMGAHVLCKHEVGVRSSHPPPSFSIALVAQLVERSISNADVRSSNPLEGTKL
jgi:hypothetical protein